MRYAQVAFLATVALALALGQPGNGAYAASPTEDRNFKPTGAPGPVVPAIPADEIRVAEGRVRVKIGSNRFGLETLTLTPPGAGPFPLAVMSPGTPTRGGKKAMRNYRLRQMYAFAEDFARRGYKAVIFARRGYASSQGPVRDGYGRCGAANERSYARGARNGAKDFAAIIRALAGEPDVDGSTVVVAGHSGGGFVVSALAAEPPPGLVGIINVSGGRGGQKEGGNCNESGFVGAFGEFGKGARVPALWLYSTADGMFWPDLVDRSLEAYASDGAPVRIERIGPLWFTDNGHMLHELGAREYWRPRIDDFLNAIGAPNWETAPDDAAVDKLPPPSNLSHRGRGHWRRYLGHSGHKAFVMAKSGRFAWRVWQDTADEAIRGAMKSCEKDGAKCRVISIDGEMAP